MPGLTEYRFCIKTDWGTVPDCRYLHFELMDDALRLVEQYGDWVLRYETAQQGGSSAIYSIGRLDKVPGTSRGQVKKVDHVGIDGVTAFPWGVPFQPEFEIPREDRATYGLSVKDISEILGRQFVVPGHGGLIPLPDYQFKNLENALRRTHDQWRKDRGR